MWFLKMLFLSVTAPIWGPPFFLFWALHRSFYHPSQRQREAEWRELDKELPGYYDRMKSLQRKFEENQRKQER